MKIDVRLTIETLALAAIVLAVYLATDLVWPALVAFAACLAYVAYVWELDTTTITLRRPRIKGLRRGKKPVRK